VLTIADDTGRQIRRLDVDKSVGLRRIVWNLRGDPPPPGTQPAGGGGGRQGGGFGGRGGPPQGPQATPGRYRATLGRMVGDTVTPIGAPQTFSVVQIPQ
jgi:hypothetical protein